MGAAETVLLLDKHEASGPAASGAADSRAAKCPYENYRFSPLILDRLRPLLRKDNYHGLLQLIEDWVVIGGATALSVWAWRHASMPFAIGAYAVAVAVIGARQRALADLLHQATHRTLARSPWLNVFLGTWPSGDLVLQSYTGYHASHVRRHHPLLGDPAQDPDYAALIASGLYGSRRSPGAVRRYLWRLVRVGSTVEYVRYLLTNRIANPDEALRERWLRLLYLAVLAGVAIWTGAGVLVVAYWLVPMLTTANWLGRLIELAEHYPLMETAPRVSLYMTRNRLCGWLANFLLGLHWEGFHQVHHLFPSMPSWHFPEAHQILLDDPRYAALNRSRGWPALIREMVVLAGNPAVDGRRAERHCM